MSEQDEVIDSAPEPYMASMLSAYREEEDLPSDVRARVQRRLEQAPVAAAPPRVANGGRAIWIGVAVAAVIVGIIVAPRLGSRDAAEEGTSAEYRSEDGGPERAHERAVILDDGAQGREPDGGDEHDPEGEGEDEAGAPEVEGGAVTPEARPKTATPPVERRPPKKKPDAGSAELVPQSPTDSLKEETALLRKAQAKLAGGSPRGALTPLTEHKKRFPDGVLTEERRALTAVALCEDGQRERGAKQAQRFFSDYPGSALRERVRTACPGDDG